MNTVTFPVFLCKGKEAIMKLLIYGWGCVFFFFAIFDNKQLF